MCILLSAAPAMSSLCLSSVLTGANFAVYQTSVSDVVPQQPGSSGVAYASGTSGEHLWFPGGGG